MRAIFLASVLTASAFLAGNDAQAADAPCRIVHAAETSMGTDEDGGVIVPLTIGGTTLHVLVDTGGLVSMLTKSTVAKLGLATSSINYGRSLVMFGGTHIDRAAIAYDIDFGGLKARSMQFAIMPDGWLGAGVDGTLAPDVLSAYDAEFDFANNKFYLNSQNHCPGKVVYWTATPYTVIPMRIDHFGHVVVEVNLDGKFISASLDTGSTRSHMSLDAAKDEFNLNEKNPDLKLLPDTAKDVHIYHYPFKSLSLEGITIQNPDLILMSDEESHQMGPDEARIILGMGILRQLHFYIAYGETKIYATGASAH